MFASLTLSAATAAALAADLQTKVPPPVFMPPVPVFTWTGAYTGGQIGYEFGKNTLSSPGDFRGFSYNQSGADDCAHPGFNKQYNQFVVGLEGDVNGSSYKGPTVNPYNGVLVGARIPVDGAMRGRAGVASDRVLLYATGGMAFATITNTYTKADFVQLSQYAVVYTVGGSLEYALNDLWSVRGEYRYTKYGNYSSYPNNVVFARFNDASDKRVTFGFSYQFAAPPLPEPAVVAKY